MNTRRNGDFTLYLKTAIPLLGGLVERASFLHKGHLWSAGEILSTKQDSVFPSPSPNPTVRPKLASLQLLLPYILWLTSASCR